MKNTLPRARRHFRPSRARVAALACSLAALFAVSSRADSVGAHWYQRPLLITQTVLREPDAKDYDVKALIEYLDASASNTLVVNAGGIVDFFQNPLPAANINPFLEGRDLLGDIVEACHARGVRVVARVDFRGVEERVYRQRPEWFARNADGSPQTLNYTRPELYVGCYAGHYRNAHAERFVDYVLETYGVDGIWHNSIGVDGICYCDDCAASFRAATGRALPVEGESAESELGAYMGWKSLAAKRHMDRLRAAVKRHGEDKAYVAEVFGMYDQAGTIHSGIDLYSTSERFDFLVSVAFIRPNRAAFEYEDLGYASSIVNLSKALDPSKEAIILFGGNGTAHRYAREAPLDTRLWLWEAFSAGGRFWNCNFTGQNPAVTYDRRNAFVGRAAYETVAASEALVAGQAPLADVGIYYSNANRKAYRNLYDADAFGDTIQGVEQVLRDNHIQYAFVPDRGLTAEKLARFKAVVLSNVALMSDAEVALFDAYARGGGKILATFETSLYDAEGARRAEFALADAFGARLAGEAVDTRTDCYQRILRRDGLARGFEDTELLLNAGRTLLVRPDASPESAAFLGYVPRVHNQPPEKAWIDDLDSGYATAIRNRYGKGEVLYFANSIGQLAYTGDNGDFHALLSNAFDELVPDRLLRANAPPSVRVALTRNEAGVAILSLINRSASPARRPLGALVPVRDLWVEIDLVGAALRAHRTLRADEGAEIAVAVEGGRIRVSVSELREFVAVALEL